MADIAARTEKTKCPYCGETNFQESEFCWACYKNLRIPEGTRHGQKPAEDLTIPGNATITGKIAEPKGRAAVTGDNSYQSDPLIPPSSDAQISGTKFSAYGRLTLVAGLFIFYLQWIRKENYFSFLDFINLAFHEAGHLFLGFFGRFIMMLGGTIFQLLIPAVCAVHLRRQDNRIGWQLCLFWFGENLLNISIYAGDAINQALPLVGGGEHDWTYLLTATHLIAHTPATAKAIFLTGSAIIFWSLYLIARDGIETLLVLKSNK